MHKFNRICGFVSRQSWRVCLVLLLIGVVAASTGCGTGKKKENQGGGFFTSGSQEADQRASQRMAKAEQTAGTGEGAGEKESKKIESTGAQAPTAPGKQTLYDRLGGQQGLAALVDDFTSRALQDPRVNWQRKGVTRASLFHRGQTVSWTSTPQNVAALKNHLIEFLSLTTGGPAKYEGQEIKQAHANMHISNPEFDAAVGDLKASLDKLQVPNKEQKELLAIIESTRPEIVTER